MDRTKSKTGKVRTERPAAAAYGARAAFLRGRDLAARGRLDEAAASYREAIESDPNYAEAHNNLGNLLRETGQTDAAIGAYASAIKARPDYALAHFNLGCVHHAAGDTDQARSAYQHAIAAKPDWAEPHYNRATILENDGDLHGAARGFRRTVTVDPTHSGGWNNLGLVLRKLGRHHEALAAHARAIANDPANCRARFNAALAHLTRGEFEAGWPLYEARLEIEEVQRKAGIGPLDKRWRGEPLHGRSLLVEAEQGLGDTIQFVRYLPMLKADAETDAAPTVTLACDKALLRLFSGLPGADRLLERRPDATKTPRGHDLTVSLLSLPSIFETSLDTIPAPHGYLAANPALSASWAERVNGDAFKVGLAWAGRPQHENDRNRSLQLTALAPLARVSGVRFFSLQKGPAEREANHPPQDMPLIKLGSSFADMADTAAAIANLDLVITVDTAVAHLAGALGRQVWTLVPFVPDWRWMLDRGDSPWYPTMRLYRQDESGDWAPVIERVADALAQAANPVRDTLSKARREIAG